MGMWQAIIARDINSVQHHPDKVRHVAAAYYASKLQVSAGWPTQERQAHLENKHRGLLARVHHRARGEIVAARNDAVAQLTPPPAAQPAPAPRLPALAPPSIRAQAPRNAAPAAPSPLPAQPPPAVPSSPPAYATVAARGAARGRAGASPARRAAGTRPGVSPGRHVPAGAPQPPRSGPPRTPLPFPSPPAALPLPPLDAPVPPPPADNSRQRPSSADPSTPGTRRSYAEVLSASLTSLPPRDVTSGDNASPQRTSLASPASPSSPPVSSR